MASCDTAIRALCKSLGKDYRVTIIDGEKVIYRDFGNGFNVEISGVYTTSKRKRANIYLWYGDEGLSSFHMDTVWHVTQEDIGEVVEILLNFSNWLIASGIDTRDKIIKTKLRLKDFLIAQISTYGALLHAIQ